MSAYWQALEGIFARARELPRERQAEFLASACGTDAALRADAESLLSASGLTGEFLERPALDRLARAFANEGLNLKPGLRIGAYTILRPLGAGGAGEVWRAKDGRLDRDVAIKVLLPHLSADADKLRRFAEEARAAGQLNHPNIVTVHDVGEHDGLPYLVSECLEGRNLRERMKASRLPLAEALAVTAGVAQGLAAAHERGLVHRDLKPENVFLKSDGGVKLLDFGLAKLGLAATPSPDAAIEGTASLLAGTAAYMAPEQARGEPPDPRSDLFALGVMMYEMLAGAHPFRGSSVFETLSAILAREPADLASANPAVPLPIARVVMRLLDKSPAARFQSARDLAWSLAQAADAAAPRPPARIRVPRWLRFGVPAAILVAVAAGAWLARQWPERTPAGSLTRFAWSLPKGAGLESPPAVSPDGRRIAFAGRDGAGVRLFVRDLDATEARAIAGTEGAELPFWSPDGQALGYFSKGQMRRVALPDGAPAPVAPAPAGRGAAWLPSGTIVFAPDLILAGLQRVSAAGGAPEPVTMLDESQGETSHWWPVALPDGRHVVYYVRSADPARRGIYLARADQPPGPPGERLFFSDSGASVLPLAGVNAVELVYLAEGRVEARRLDMRTRTVAAQARTLDWMRARPTLVNPLLLSASAEVLAYSETMVPAGNRLVSLTLEGTGAREWPQAEAHNWPRISPDGRLIARAHVDESWSQPDIRVEDLERGTVFPVLQTREPDMSPVWSPDGRRLAFVTGHLPRRGGVLALNLVAADGTGVERTLECPGDYCEPTDWSADGTSLLVTVLARGQEDVWILPAGPTGEAQPLLTAEYGEKDARYSPDGRWVAYTSTEAGRPEVLVRSVGGVPRRMAVSGEGGTQAVWRRDGRALYFVGLDGRLRSVQVTWSDAGDPRFSLPTRLALPQVGFGHWGTQYDISPDGRRIYFMEPSRDPPPREIQVAIHWRELLGD